MVQISSFNLQLQSNHNEVLAIIKERVKQNSWYNALIIEGNEIKVKDNKQMTVEEYNSLVFSICKDIVKTMDISFFCKADFCSSDLEIRESFVYQNKYIQHYYVKEVYVEDSKEELYYFGEYKNNQFEYEEVDKDSYDMEEVMCPYCGEYIFKHKDVPFSYCPICDCIDVEEIETEEVADYPWLKHEFEIPLGVTLPCEVVSKGQDWHSDCEEDKVFGLQPYYYVNKNQYDAALNLCRACDGWYHYEEETTKKRMIECYRQVIQAKPYEPMWYYSVYKNNFSWLDAIRECNPKYKGKLLNIEDTWDLFSKLGNRSFLEKAECFEWIVEYFGDYLEYDTRYKISDSYVQSFYDSSLETVLYLRESQIEILTKSAAKISGYNTHILAKAAAGLLRMGKKEVGLSLYKKAFAMSWTDKTSVEDKKRVVDSFIDRLSQGYENETYLDKDIIELLEKQCQKYSDGAWTSKIRMSFGK